MRSFWPSPLPWILAALLSIAAGGLLIVRGDIAQRREAFRTDARAVHRLLSLRMAQHETVLAVLALQPFAADATGVRRDTAGLPPGYPQLLAAWFWKASPDGSDVAALPDPALAAAVAEARGAAGANAVPGNGAVAAVPRDGAAGPGAGRRHGALVAVPGGGVLGAVPGGDALGAVGAAGPSSIRLGPVDAATGRYWLLLPAPQGVHALHIDAKRLWSSQESLGPASVTLAQDGWTLSLQPGAPPQAQPSGLTSGFTFAQPLDSASQPFELRVQRATGPAEWPWALLALWAALCGISVVAVRRAWVARLAARRAVELARLSNVARLNTLGELAAGMAHELNQPLTAVLAGTQTALRLLRDPQPEDDPLPALELAASQARRAADVVARLRRLVQPAAPDPVGEAVDLAPLAQQLIGWMRPEWARQGIVATVEGAAPPAQGDRVAIEQILHNLLLNASQALQQVPAHRRRIAVRLSAANGRVRAEVRDSGPGVAAADRMRLFEPFFTTRADGLGLGLPLCQSLAQAMGGQLELADDPPPAGLPGAGFVFTCPAGAPSRDPRAS